MEFNYNAELLKFKSWQKEQVAIMSESGMREEDIEKIKEEDWERFKSERIFCIHNFSSDALMKMAEDMEEEGRSPLLEKNLDKLSFYDKYMDSCKEDWISNIADKKLYEALRSLTPNQLDLAYSIYECRMTLNDYAIREGVSLAAVSKMHKKILEKIKKVY